MNERLARYRPRWVYRRERTIGIYLALRQRHPVLSYRVVPLVFLSLLVFVVWVWLHYQWPSNWHPDDPHILIGIGVVYGVAAVVMMIGTEEWSLRSLGLLATVVADMGLYGRSGVAQMRWVQPFNQWELNLLRALFIVGGVLLTIGLIRWARSYVRERIMDDEDGVA